MAAIFHANTQSRFRWVDHSNRSIEDVLLVKSYPSRLCVMANMTNLRVLGNVGVGDIISMIRCNDVIIEGVTFRDVSSNGSSPTAIVLKGS